MDGSNTFPSVYPLSGVQADTVLRLADNDRLMIQTGWQPLGALLRLNFQAFPDLLPCPLIVTARGGYHVGSQRVLLGPSIFSWNKQLVI